MRRLIRVCLFYGANPQFICCSATMNSSAEHMKRLLPIEEINQLLNTNREIIEIGMNEDGSPRGKKFFIFI